MPSRIAHRVLMRFAQRVGFDFSTPEAFREYLHEHPQADKSKHRVVKPEEKAKKEPEKTPGESAKMDSKAPQGAALFKSEELKDLPELASQKEKDPDKLFAQATKAHEQQLNWLNHGKGLDKALGAKVVRGDTQPLEAFLKEQDEETAKKGPLIVIGPMKSKERAQAKIDGQFGGDWSKAVDLVRASVAVDSMDQVKDVMSKLRASGLKLARLPKDRFAEPTEAGYRDLSLNVEYPDGHVGELQIHLKPILRAKSEGHEHYEQIRKITESAKKEGRTTLTEEEQKMLDEANKKSSALYDKAWKSAMGGESEPRDKNAAWRIVRRFAAAPKYYDYDGVPAQWEHLKFPQMVTPNGTKVVYDLEKFFNTAQPIDEAKFEKLKESQ